MSGREIPPLRIAGCISDSIVDGPGLRYTVFVQGCPHHCPGCHNPETHPFAGGYLADVEEIVRQVGEDPLLSGVTFSGGEPFCQAEALVALDIGPLGELLAPVGTLEFEDACSLEPVSVSVCDAADAEVPSVWL